MCLPLFTTTKRKFNAMNSNKSLAGSLNKSPAVIGSMGTAKDLISKMLPAIAQALPKHLNADRMSRIILTEFHKNPKLIDCSQASIIGGILQSSQLGLEIGSGLGHAYLIPFDKKGKVDGEWKVVSTEAQLIIGYQGMLELARRSGELIAIHASAVRKGDHFIHRRSLEADILEHEEKYDSDEVTHFYAMARLKGGGHTYLVWPAKKMKEHALRHSKAMDYKTKEKKLSGPWETDYEAMGCKTMIRALFKFLPKSAEMNSAIEADGNVIRQTKGEEFTVDLGDAETATDTALLSTDSYRDPTPLEQIEIYISEIGIDYETARGQLFAEGNIELDKITAEQVEAAKTILNKI